MLFGPPIQGMADSAVHIAAMEHGDGPRAAKALAGVMKQAKEFRLSTFRLVNRDGCCLPQMVTVLLSPRPCRAKRFIKYT